MRNHVCVSLQVAFGFSTITLQMSVWGGEGGRGRREMTSTGLKMSNTTYGLISYKVKFSSSLSLFVVYFPIVKNSNKHS